MARICFGTSGFSYKEWKPVFYQPDLTEKQFLRYYSVEFRQHLNYDIRHGSQAMFTGFWRNTIWPFASMTRTSTERHSNQRRHLRMSASGGRNTAVRFAESGRNGCSIGPIRALMFSLTLSTKIIRTRRLSLWNLRTAFSRGTDDVESTCS